MSENKMFVVVPNGTKHQVVLMVDEWYRDQPGNLRKRRVVARRFETFDTPMEAFAVAQRWNIEDGNTKGGDQ